MAAIDSSYLPWSPSCDEYFADFRDGRFDEESQHWFICPLEETSIDEQRGALVIGYAGCDGIDFCFRANTSGIWAYYPIEERWEPLAKNLHDLERGWLAGEIAV